MEPVWNRIKFSWQISGTLPSSVSQKQW